MGHPLKRILRVVFQFCLWAFALGLFADLVKCEEGPEVKDTEVRSAPVVPSNFYGFQQIAYDLKYIVKRPFHLDREDGLWLAGTGTAAAGLFAVREDISDWVLDHQNDTARNILDAARVMGSGGFAPTLALASYGASILTENDREKETALLLMESAALSQASAFVGQALIPSGRPTDGEVEAFRTRGHGVSGDAALAASIISPLRRQYLIVAPTDRPLTAGYVQGAVWVPQNFCSRVGSLRCSRLSSNSLLLFCSGALRNSS